MPTKEADFLAEVEAASKKYNKIKKEEKKAKEQPFTKADMEKLIIQMQGGPQPSVNVASGQTGDPSIIITQQHPAQKQPTERQQIAYQIWKDQKTLSIVCLIAFILPMCTALLATVGTMYALILAFAGMMYPLMAFVKSMGIQARLHAKYGFKPLFQLQKPIQQNRMPRPPQQQNNNKEVLL